MSGIDRPSQKPLSQSSSNQQTTFTTLSGTKRTSIEVRCSGAIGGKADIARIVQFGKQ
jgi:hypothetical protein